MNYSIGIEQAAAELDQFDAILDARSPAEFAEDHLPGAVNWPVLDDEERRIVGTLYKTDSLAAKRLGATLVARNVARLIEQRTQDFGKTWRPLVYCWRGGQRSLSLHWFLGQIGFRSRQLTGGYKAYRTRVLEQLDVMPRQLRWQVLCGRTGSGKTRLLQAIAAAGGQVLDLEGLALHRGSLLGAVPGSPQPSQKAFDSQIWAALRSFDPARPVFVESESRKVGQLRVPEALHLAMLASPDLHWVSLPQPARIRLLLQDYAHFAADVESFCLKLDGLIEMRGHATVQGWQAMARAGDWAALLGSLMVEHYDPMYDRSLRAHYTQLDTANPIELPDAEGTALQAVARALLDRHQAPPRGG